MVSSDWPSMSMNPGAMTSPCASMTVRALTAPSRPIAAMWPALIARSPAYQGDPVPSTMWPFLMTRSNWSGGACPWSAGAAAGAQAQKARILRRSSDLSTVRVIAPSLADLDVRHEEDRTLKGALARDCATGQVALDLTDTYHS